jgi:hypothetical protein
MPYPLHIDEEHNKAIRAEVGERLRIFLWMAGRQKVPRHIRQSIDRLDVGLKPLRRLCLLKTRDGCADCYQDDFANLHDTTNEDHRLALRVLGAATARP